MSSMAVQIKLLMFLACCAVAWPAAVEATTKSGPAGDNVVVHLFEWSWKDIEEECPNLGKWGYWGVQVRVCVTGGCVLSS